MAEDETAGDPDSETPKKKSKLPLLVGLVLALGGGGGGFYAVSAGLILDDGTHVEEHADDSHGPVGALPDIAFVPVDPLVISLGERSRNAHLRFVAQLEVAEAHQEEVQLLMPRILDVLNGYLRAVDVRDLEEPTALIRLRAQMLRRVQIVTGDGRVRDLLVSEFVLN